MNEFKRGIKNQDFIQKLKTNKHWQNIANDDNLFIAIHKEVIHVYYFGQRICEVKFLVRSKKLKWTTHQKYLGIQGNRYVDMENYLDKIEDIKSAAKKYGGREKEEVKRNILENKNYCILDVEITFGKEEEFGKRSIDFLALEKSKEGKPKLVFYEAKHCKNSEIKAINKPKVFDQIEKYENILNDSNHIKEIFESYKIIYENIIALDLPIKDKLISIIGETYDDIEIDIKPRLIIFKYDPKKLQDIHLEKLQNKFGYDRVILN